jgi:hypothetical protein
MKTSLLLCLCLIFTTGCHQLYYVPSMQNVPLFREKNDFQMAGSYSMGSESQNAELQTAYSITNHLGITANLMKSKIGSYERKNFVSGMNYDVSIGYYMPVGSKSVFEVYSGYGRNKQHHGYSHSGYNSTTGTDEYFSDGDAYLKYRKVYFQPAFGLSTDRFDLAGSIRLSHLWYTHIAYDVVDHNEDILLMEMLKDQDHFIIEPAITIRTGWRYIKFQFQASYAEYLNDLDEEDDYYDFVEGPHISCGFYLTLSNRWRKR